MSTQVDYTAQLSQSWIGHDITKENLYHVYNILSKRIRLAFE